MSRWVAYPIMIAAVALCLFAFDRVLVAEHGHCTQARSNLTMAVIAREFDLFLCRRMDAVRTAGELIRESASEPGEVLDRHYKTIFGHLEDVEFVRLVSRDGGALVARPETSGLNANDLPFVLAGPPSAAGIDVQTYKNTPDSLNLLTRSGGPDQGEVYIWARFGLGPLFRQLSGSDIAGDLDAYVSDLDGTPVIGVPRGDASDYELAGPLIVPGKSWALRVRTRPEAWYGLPLRRALLCSMGLIMIGGFGAVCLLRNRHYRELSEHNVELAQQTEQHRTVVERLLRLNRDLDEFTYIVSHDLKEPLRGVEGIAKLLIEDYGGSMDETGRHYLESIKSSGKRMRRLVDDLLRLSRVTGKRYPLEKISFDDLVEDTLRTMDYHLKEKNAIVMVQPHLPAVVSDRVRLAELLQNLISNALKFMKTPTPRIEIGYEPRPDSHLFWIMDNGIGVPPEDQERIFNIFQRTSSPEFSEGSGVGLAICRRIVENLGGRIWVESGPEAGSRFCFTLPAGSETSPTDGACHEHSAAQHLVG